MSNKHKGLDRREERFHELLWMKWEGGGVHLGVNLAAKWGE